MNEFRFRFVNVLFFLLLLGSSYWAFQKMNPRFHYTAEDLVVREESERNSHADQDNRNEEEAVQYEDYNKLGRENEKENPRASREEGTEKEENTQEESSQQLDEEHQFLLTKLQGLIDDKIYMKKGSRGTRVGTVQKFLNLYFDKKIRVDNEYGPNTMYLVRKFQQKEGLSPDGLAGPETYQKMIELIKERRV